MNEVEVEHEGITTKITRKALIYVTFISFQLEIGEKENAYLSLNQ